MNPLCALRRRQSLAVIAASAGWPVRAAALQPALQLLGAPQPLAQIAAGGPTGLLAIGSEGTLYALALDGGRVQPLASGIDAQTPLAIGHGRIAARRLDGGLWVHEAGRASASSARMIAPAAGLLVLPLAIIGIGADDNRHRVVRLEPTSAGSWSAVARSSVEVLPDARPIQADLDGSGDGGHLVVLAGPDGERYPHGVLGDAVEATRVAWIERHSLTVMRELVIEPPHVLEDIAPRRVAIGSRDGLLTVQAGPQGGQLVLVDADPSRAKALRIAAMGPPLGTANRWLSPTVEGRHWLAVHTPHIGGVLHRYRLDGGRLHAERLLEGVSNHAIGSRQLDLAAWQGEQLLVPDQGRQRMLLLDGRSGWQRVHEWPLPSRVMASASLGGAAGVAILLANGSVAVARPSA